VSIAEKNGHVRFFNLYFGGDFVARTGISCRFDLDLSRGTYDARLTTTPSGMVRWVCDFPSLQPFEGVLTHLSQGPEDIRPGPFFDPGCADMIAGAAEGELWQAGRGVLGEMTSTPVGYGTFVQNGCLEVSALYGGEASHIQVVGDATLTTKRGDTLYWTYAGLVDPITLIAQVDVFVHGGTGKFRGATGGFSTTSEGNALDFPVTYPFSGEIGYLRGDHDDDGWDDGDEDKDRERRRGHR
jgi:hypothetical protein